MILCNARAMGEFGAVYVVSSGFAEQNTLPLYINLLEHESRGINLVPTFAVSSLLGVLAVVTLVAKTWVESRSKTAREDPTAAARPDKVPASGPQQTLIHVKRRDRERFP